MSAKSVRRHLEEYNGKAPGFDALRLLLAVLIVLWHTVYVCYGRFSEAYELAGYHPLVLPVLRALLPMFFFLSGFLVTGSAYRVRSVGRFLQLRVLRILPALFVEVMLCAVVLGSLATTLPLAEYYAHPGFREYFLNIIGLVHFELPGVFTQNTVPTTSVVNLNLWTLPAELECYIIMAALMLTGTIFSRKYFGIMFGLLTVFFLILLPLKLNWGLSPHVYIEPRLLLYSFLLGAFCFVFADKIPVSKAAAALAFFALFFFLWQYTVFLGMIAACYLTLCFGMLRLDNLPLIKTGDYSYGVYLYGFPIERALFYYGHEWLTHWWQLFLVAMPVTLAFAVLSWHFIEKPCLKLRRRISRNSP